MASLVKTRPFAHRIVDHRTFPRQHELSSTRRGVGRVVRACRKTDPGEFQHVPPDAVWIVRVLLFPDPEGWHATMEYGLDGSAWEADPRKDRWRGENSLAPTQRKNESLINFVARARSTFERWLLPEATNPCEGGPNCDPIAIHAYDHADPIYYWADRRTSR